jgi:hypothetical protein
MKYATYLLGVVLLILLVINGINFSRQLSFYTGYGFRIDESVVTSLKGFDADDEGHALRALVGKINARVSALNESTRKLKLYNIIAIFTATALTGLAALLTSIHSLKGSGTLDKRISVWVIALTFVSTLGNSAGAHLNQEQEELNVKMQQVEKLREDLFTAYRTSRENNDDVKLLLLNYESRLSGF